MVKRRVTSAVNRVVVGSNPTLEETLCSSAVEHYATLFACSLGFKFDHPEDFDFDDLEDLDPPDYI